MIRCRNEKEIRYLFLKQRIKKPEYTIIIIKVLDRKKKKKSEVVFENVRHVLPN